MTTATNKPVSVTLPNGVTYEVYRDYRTWCYDVWIDAPSGGMIANGSRSRWRDAVRRARGIAEATLEAKP